MLIAWFVASAILTAPQDLCACVAVSDTTGARAVSTSCLILHVSRADVATPSLDDGAPAAGWLSPLLVRFSTRGVEIATLLHAHGWRAFRRIMQADELPYPAAIRDSIAPRFGQSKSAVLCVSVTNTDITHLATALRACDAVDSVRFCRTDLFRSGEEPEALVMVFPEWPRRPGPAEGGRVWVRVWIRESGSVSRVRVERSELDAAFESSALEAATQWIFKPASEHGTPTRAEIVIPFRFERPTRTAAAPRRTDR